MSEIKYVKCASCGSIHDRDEIPTARDPYASDGTVEFCPDCNAAEDFDSVTIMVMHDQSTNGWLAYFADREGSKVSPFKSGRTEEEAREALLESYQLLI